MINEITRDVGFFAEHLAQRYLEDKGLKLITQNYQCYAGEIDLIMRDDNYLIFIEVRKRENPDCGLSIETITPIKQRKIIRTAMHYLVETDQVDRVDCRFDVFGIDLINGRNQITWIPNAFDSFT